jgi:hypothetical protein
LTIVPPFSLSLTLYSLCVAGMQGWTRKSYIHNSKMGLFCSIGALFSRHMKKIRENLFTSKNAALVGLYVCVIGYSDFHNLMGFTSKKMAIILIYVLHDPTFI